MAFNTFPPLVSAHGAHSGQFCLHASDNLEEMVKEYIRKGFCWVGITEHMPPLGDMFRYADEQEACISARTLQEQFGAYVTEARRLQERYRDNITIYVGMESECYPGAFDYALKLHRHYALDYIVGSVHHVRGVNFDFSADEYRNAIKVCGGIDSLYCAYFDEQLQMIETLKPKVVGHFDLVRLYDAEYSQRLCQPDIAARIKRNLAKIMEYDLCLDLNMRALMKGASEPYISRPILLQAVEMGIDILPGDDSHSVDSVGAGIEDGIRLLQQLGYGCRWRRPL